MSTIFDFGRFSFSRRTLELTRDGRPVPLAPQPARVLALLLENPGTLLLREEIQDRIWPDEPSRVTRQQGLNTCIRQIRDALGDNASSPTYIETLPQRGYRFIAPVEVDDRENPSILETSDDAADPERGPWSAGLVSYATAGLVGLLAIIGFARFVPALIDSTDPEAASHARLAILPFEDMSGNANRETFALGLTEEVTSRLASVDPDRLDVVAFTSTRRLDRAAGVAEAGRRVHADYVLDGSVRSEGNRFRVSAQLVAVSSGNHLWAEQFEGEFGSLLDLQQSLGDRIASAILPAVSETEIALRSSAPSEPSPAARLPYLEGVHLLAWETTEGARAAVDRLREAVRLDDDFALGHATLAEALFWSGRRGEAERSARRALELDERLPEAHVVLAEVLLDRDFAFGRAEAHFRRALELAPGRAAFQRAYAHYLTAVGRHDEALARLADARELDPLSPALDGDAGWHLYWAGRYEDAADRCASLSPLMRGVVRARGERCALQALVRLERFEEARIHALNVMEIAGASNAEVSEVQTAPAREALDAYAAWSVQPEHRAIALGADTPFRLARALADLGEVERALSTLEEAYRVRDRGFLMLAVEPRFSKLRDEPRFERLIRKTGLPGAVGAPAGTDRVAREG